MALGLKIRMGAAKLGLLRLSKSEEPENILANYNTAKIFNSKRRRSDRQLQWPSSRPPSVAAAAAEDGTRLIRADQGHLQYGGLLTILPKKFLATHITRELDPPLPDARTHLPSSPSTVLPLALHLLLH